MGFRVLRFRVSPISHGSPKARKLIVILIVTLMAPHSCPSHANQTFMGALAAASGGTGATVGKPCVRSGCRVGGLGFWAFAARTLRARLVEVRKVEGSGFRV